MSLFCDFLERLRLRDSCTAKLALVARSEVSGSCRMGRRLWRGMQTGNLLDLPYSTSTLKIYGGNRNAFDKHCLEDVIIESDIGVLGHIA